MTDSLTDSAGAPGRDDRATRPAPKARKVVSSAQLPCGQHELAIDHGGEFYRLRVTSNGKLILHK